MRRTGSAAALLLAACSTAAPPSEPDPASLRRLTRAQYENAVRDLLGADIVLPPNPEPDVRAAGLLEVGALASSLSPRGVEGYEAGAFVLAEQALSPERRASIVPCEPSAAVDAQCAAAFVTAVGRRAWRRPLTADEVQTVAALGTNAASALSDFYEGLEFSLATLLQAPEFLYRIELGEDGEGGRRFTPWETASRLSFLLWNRPPDDALLDAAERGDLLDPDGIVVEAERMLADPRARAGLEAFFADMMQLAELDDLYKDGTLYPFMSDTLPDAMYRETVSVFSGLVLDERGDLRDLATRTRTEVDAELAALYSVRSPTREGFAAIDFGEDSVRRGLLGQASYLALHAHPTNTSPTLRGKFLREVLLCQSLPGPPANVDTSIPPVTEEAPTLRERVDRHLSDPGCASCHLRMDPIGLGLEQFDGIGRYRDRENGAPIDASGDLDGVAYDDARGLGDAVRDHEDFGRCFVRTLVRYANARREGPGEIDTLEWLEAETDRQDYRFDVALLDLLGSDLFLAAGDPAEDTE
jgi:hypothetical protein